MKFVLFLLVMLIFSYSSLGDYFSNEDDNLESKVILNAIGVTSNLKEKNQFLVKKDELTKNIAQFKQEIKNLDNRQEKLLDQSNQKNKDLTKIKTNEADLQLSQFEIEQNSELAIKIGVLLDSLKIDGQDRQLMLDILILFEETVDKELTSDQQSFIESMFAKLSHQNKEILSYIILNPQTTNEPNSKQVFNHTLWTNFCVCLPLVFLNSLNLFVISRFLSKIVLVGYYKYFG